MNGSTGRSSSDEFMPLLEEVGTMPTEKHAVGPELLAHAQAIGRQYDLYSRALLGTTVTEVAWNEELSRWVVSTDRGDVLHTASTAISTSPVRFRGRGTHGFVSCWRRSCGNSGRPGKRTVTRQVSGGLYAAPTPFPEAVVRILWGWMTTSWMLLRTSPRWGCGRSCFAR